MLQLASQIDAAAETIRRRWNGQPRVGMILGTGLGGFTDHIEQELVIDYEEIPHFPRSTAPGHRGRFVCGNAARAVLGFAQRLRNHCLKRFREHGADHFFFFGRENVNDPVYRFGGA